MTTIDESGVDADILLVSIAEAARRLGISERCAWSMVLGGELPSVRVRHRRLIAVEALRRYVAALARQGASRGVRTTARRVASGAGSTPEVHDGSR